MDPISSAVSSRTGSVQAPLPAQQRRDDEAISAPQPRTDSFSNSAPGRDLQLQRRQVVEDLGKNEAAQASLQNDPAQQAALGAQAQTLARDFPYPQTSERSQPVQSSREASELTRQVQNQLRQEPASALGAQANADRQTALTLFQ